MRPEVLAYFAGLFDGEGWFEINRGARGDCRRGYAFQVRAAMTMKSFGPIFDLARLFGGSLNEQTSRSAKHAKYYRWLVSGEKAYSFVIGVLPYLRVKRAQAKLVLKFQRYKRTNRNKPNSDARHDRLMRMYEQMLALNKKGPRS